jgi:hypothetical protein
MCNVWSSFMRVYTKDEKIAWNNQDERDGKQGAGD